MKLTDMTFKEILDAGFQVAKNTDFREYATKKEGKYVFFYPTGFFNELAGGFEWLRQKNKKGPQEFSYVRWYEGGTIVPYEEAETVNPIFSDDIEITSDDFDTSDFIVGGPSMAPRIYPGMFDSEESPHDKIEDKNTKLPFSLLPLEWTVGLVHLLAKGARKYAPRDWESGEIKGVPMSYMSRIDSLERHLGKWKSGKTRDEETGSHHLVAVAFNALMIMTWEVRGLGNDDRPTVATAYIKALEEDLK